MLTSIEIENFRGIRQGKLEGFAGLNILVGVNGCGKSALLDAIELSTNPRPISDVFSTMAQRRPTHTSPARWLLHKGNSKSKLHADRSENGKCEVVLDPQIDALGQLTQIAVRVYGFQNGNRRTIEAGRLMLNGSFGQDSSSDRKENYGVLSLPIYSSVNWVDTLSRLRDLGQGQSLDWLLSAIDSSAQRLEFGTDSGSTYLVVHRSRGTVPLALEGEGFQRAIHFGLALANFPGGIALIEEPETHLHPRAMHEVAKVIVAAVKQGIQVFLSTHSLEMIDALLQQCEAMEVVEKLQVIRMQLTDGCLKTVQVPGVDVQYVRDRIGDDLR